MKEDSTLFDYKLEQWISKQGLFFLITYGSGRGSLTAKLVSVFLRLVVILLIGLVIAWFYLKGRVETDGFKEDVIQQVSQGLSADKVEIKSITRVSGGIISGDMFLKSLKLGETEKSFFEDWRVSEYKVNADGSKTEVEVVDVAKFNSIYVSPLNVADNVLSGWSAKEIRINSMELKLKTGAETDELALESYASLFRKYDSLELQSIKVTDGTVYWGGSKQTAGAIKNAHFDILKNKDEWVIEIVGGTLSYAWLEDVELETMRIVCNSSGEITVEAAYLTLGEGVLRFNADIEMLAQPKVRGSYEFKKMNVLDLIGQKYEKWIGGQVNGSGRYKGTLNSAEGITYDTTVNLTGDDKEIDEENDSTILIKGNEFDVLEVVQSIDLLNNYSKIRAHKGEIKVKYQELAGICEFSLNSVRCGKSGLILMNGEFQCTENDDIPVSIEEAESDACVFSGEIKMGFLPIVFQTNENIINVFKVDEVLLRTQLDVDIEGEIHELTSKAGQKLDEVPQMEKNNR